MSFHLPNNQEKRDYVYRQFERIAARYDLTNDVISLGLHHLWKMRAVSALNCQPTGAYLDVCCGTGDLALKIARRLISTGHVTALDFSQKMLDIASERIAKALPNRPEIIQLVAADAQEMPFASNKFDGAVISFGLRNLTNWTQGLKEMSRVVKPGGRIVCLDVGHPRLPVFKSLFDLFFCHFVPIIGQILQNDRQAYTYLPESAKNFPTICQLKQLFADIGLQNVSACEVTFGAVSLVYGTKA